MKNNSEKHYLGHRKRLRNRLIQLGTEGLQEYELVELLLTYVLPQSDVKPIAKELINRFGSIKGIFDAEDEELKSVKYIKDKFISLIRLIKELNVIYHKQIALEKPVLNSIEEIAKYCMARMGCKMEEEFLVIYLDSSFKILSEKDFPAKEFYFSGTVDKAIVYPRTIIEEALKRKSYAFILVHNHPNGRLEPSEQDKILTKAIDITARGVGLILYDHLIVTADKYLSFKKEKLL